MIISKWIKVIILGLLLLCASGCETYTNSQPGDYRSMAYQDAVNAGIDPDLFVKQINQESGFNPNAISPAGAIGIAQFMPQTAASLGIDPYNAEQSLNGASHLMASYINKYGDYRKALACYNAGCNRLEWAMENCSYYYWCLPTETERYIDTITS
jgi:Transglycosylase SLT domain